MDRRAFLAAGLGLACMLPAGCGGRRSPSQPGSPITILLNPIQMAYLPIFHAIDRGYFAAEGLKVELKLYTGSANGQLPLLARGDADIGGVISAPALFNQEAEGFGIKLLCALTEPRPGYLDGVNILVRRDVWERGTFRSPSDLRGHTIDGAAEGSPVDMLVRYALMEARLTPQDVKLSYRIRSPSDVPYLFREKQVDIAGVSEPTATFIQQRGLATKWFGYSQIVPWYQDTFLGASEGFVRDREPEVRAIIRAHLRAVRDINATQGNWTPSLLDTSARWTKLKAADLRATGRIPYWSPTGAINVEALTRVQDFWAGLRLVHDRADISRLVGRHVIGSA